jgi:hypothetical protein
MKEPIAIYLYPYQLKAGDKLTDGDSPDARQFPIEGNTGLIWVDLDLPAKFAHPTAYIFVSDSDVVLPGQEATVRIERGEWWPVLNGQKILVDQDVVARTVR